MHACMGGADGWLASATTMETRATWKASCNVAKNAPAPQYSTGYGILHYGVIIYEERAARSKNSS